MTKVPITRSGHHRLLKELATLYQVVRPDALADLREARAYGVTVNNQQYLLARERCLMIERKIHDLEEKLALCEIYAGRKLFRKRVVFGALVLIQNLETGCLHSYQLVGPYESDPGNGTIATASPLGSCLMGKREGEEVTVATPAGFRTYRLLAIDFP